MAVSDEHMHSQHWLNCTVRGPEWAFAIPQGDLDALEDIMRRCSSFWNGVGSLIVPVRADGRIPGVIDEFLRARPVDGCFWHETLGEQARDGLRRKLPESQQLWDDFDRNEIHPLDLVKAAEAGRTRLVMKIPNFTSGRMRRAVLALWGYMPEPDLPYWQEKFDITAFTGNEAHVALTNGQIESAGESPLRCSRIHMHVLRSAGIDAIPYVWVLPNTNFDALVLFWNFRSRTTAPANGASVVGVLRESLGHPERLAALKQWIPRR